MRYGRTVPKGFLPVFSVDTEDEAKKLLVLTCPRNAEMDFFARELVAEQTLDNLATFSDRLQKSHDLLATNGNCECSKMKKKVKKKSPKNKKKFKKAKGKADICPNCNAVDPDPEDYAKWVLRCPECEREGCTECVMVFGNNCRCIDCEEEYEKNKRNE